MDKGSTYAIRPGARIANDITRSCRTTRPHVAEFTTSADQATRHGERLFVGFDESAPAQIAPRNRNGKSSGGASMSVVDWLVGLACHFPWLN